MNIDITRTLARPRRILDLPAWTVWTLATAGTATLTLAHVLDAAVASRRAHAKRHAETTRGRPDPERQTHAHFGVPDSWRNK